MTVLHEAAQKALEALELAVRQNSHDMMMTGEEIRKGEAAIEALRSALAQPDDKDLLTIAAMDGYHMGKKDAIAQQGQDWSLLEATQASLREHMDLVKELQDKLAQQGEPAAKYIGECHDGSLVQLYDDIKKGTELYTGAAPAPQQREPVTWKGLTDVQWMNIVNLNRAWFGVNVEDAVHEVVKLTEARLKANNAAAPAPQAGNAA